MAPRTETERKIAAVWQEVLNRERVGVQDDFFDLGGHSLLATQVMSRINRLFDVQMPLRRLFEARTVETLSAVLREIIDLPLEDSLIQMPRIRPVPRNQRLPLSFSQERLWFLHQLEPDSTTYSMPATIRMKGRLNQEALKKAFDELARRHEILRTSFISVDGQPEIEIAPDSKITITGEDLRKLPGSVREAEAARLIDEQMRVPFELSTGPLMRIAVHRLGDEDHLMHIVMHHAVCDYWSFGVMAREFETLYNSYVRGTVPTLPELSVQYADFTCCQRQWLQADVLEKYLAYWRGKLGGDLPPIELPSDRPRPLVQSRRGAERSLALPPEIVAGLGRLSHTESVSLFMVLLTAFKVLLSRYTGQDDIVIGTPIAGRTRQELEGLIGFFINTVVVRTDLSGNPPFREALKRVRETALEAYAYQDMPFEKLVEALSPQRDLSRTPLFQVFFNHIRVSKVAIELDGIKAEVFGGVEREAMFDLTLYVLDRGDAIDLKVLYSTDLFDAERIEALLRQYLHLVKQIVEQPGERIGNFSLLTQADCQRLPDPHLTIASEWTTAVHERFSYQSHRTHRKSGRRGWDRQLGLRDAGTFEQSGGQPAIGRRSG